MICQRCKEDKKRDCFYLMKDLWRRENQCRSCRYKMKIINKKGVYIKSEKRLILENYIKSMDNVQTVSDIRIATGLGNNVHSLLNNMVKHGHVKKINTTPFSYKRMDVCDYIFNKKKIK